eukprot:maker-scaffold322_size207131-snap-gene-0.13 protein:Tk09471 transcript:maker-scaffold322_size207131-snap-gene-0.13-mRNA-1 annotation:"hypothetical protein DAPPUDRAFT_94585"
MNEVRMPPNGVSGLDFRNGQEMFEKHIVVSEDPFGGARIEDIANDHDSTSADLLPDFGRESTDTLNILESNLGLAPITKLDLPPAHGGKINDLLYRTSIILKAITVHVIVLRRSFNPVVNLLLEHYWRNSSSEGHHSNLNGQALWSEVPRLAQAVHKSPPNFLWLDKIKLVGIWVGKLEKTKLFRDDPYKEERSQSVRFELVITLCLFEEANLNPFVMELLKKLIVIAGALEAISGKATDQSTSVEVPTDHDETSRSSKMFSQSTSFRGFSTRDSTILAIVREDRDTQDNLVSGFTCFSKPPGYYPDVRAQCAVYHLCYNQNGASTMKITFICPDGHKFDTKTYQCRQGHQVQCQAGFAPLVDQPALIKNPIPFNTRNEFYIDDPQLLPVKSAKSRNLNSRYDFNYKPEVWYGKTQLTCVTCCKPDRGSTDHWQPPPPKPGTPDPWATTQSPWATTPTTRRPWTRPTTTWRPPSSWVVTQSTSLPELDESEIQVIQGYSVPPQEQESGRYEKFQRRVN